MTHTSAIPHLHGDLLCFATEDDLWVAPLVPAGRRPDRAWRITVDRTRVGHPRFSPDGRQLAYTSWRSLDPEIHLAPVDGGAVPAADVLGRARHPGLRLDPRQATSWRWPRTTSPSHISAGPTRSPPTAVPAPNCPGARSAISRSVRSRGSAAPCCSPANPRTSPPPGSATAAVRRDGCGCTVSGCSPASAAIWSLRCWSDGRVAFLSDHEGIGNLYSCLPNGTDLRRHTDHDTSYARNASSDGHRVIYQCAGDLWLAEDLAEGAEPRRLPVRIGGPRAGRRSYQVPAARHIDGLSVDETGRASAVVVRGSLYWLTHRDGPARTITAAPGVRVRLPEMLGERGTGRLRHRRRGRGRHRDRLLCHGPAATARRGGWPPVSSVASTSWSPTRRVNGWRSPRTTGGCCSSPCPTTRREPAN